MDMNQVEEAPDFSEVSLVGQDLSEFSAKKLGPYIRRIDLSFNALVKVRGIETCCERMEELMLDNNQLSVFELRGNFTQLHTLSLNKNRIRDIDALIKNIKVRAKNLRYLSLLGNPAYPDQLSDDFVSESDYQIHRYHVLHHLNGLQFLDHRPVTVNELKESQKNIYADIRIFPLYTPLPISGNPLKKSSVVTTGQGSGTRQKSKSRQGKQSTKYIGKNSEGNRFIQDTDL